MDAAAAEMGAAIGGRFGAPPLPNRMNEARPPDAAATPLLSLAAFYFSPE